MKAKAKINWKNIYPLPANTVGKDAFDGGNKVLNLTGDKLIQWKDMPLNRFHIVNGKRVRMKPESKALSEPSMATMANL